MSDQDILQNLSFKLTEKQMRKIDDLIKKGLYVSKSEFLRQASWGLLSLLIKNQMLVQVNKEHFSPLNDSMLKNNPEDSISGFLTTARFPVAHVTIIDGIVEKSNYTSRSHFIRDAVDKYLKENTTYSMLDTN